MSNKVCYSFFGNRGLGHRSGHLDRSQRKSRRKWLIFWGGMPRLTLSEHGICRKDDQGRNRRAKTHKKPLSIFVLQVFFMLFSGSLHADSFTPTEISMVLNSVYATTRNAFYDNNPGLAGQCTWYAYGRVIELAEQSELDTSVVTTFENAFWDEWGRDARQWMIQEKFLGPESRWTCTSAEALPTEMRRKGMLAVWNPGKGDGHVGFVEEVSADKSEYRLSDFNRRGDKLYRNQWYPFLGNDSVLGVYPCFLQLPLNGNSENEIEIYDFWRKADPITTGYTFNFDAQFKIRNNGSSSITIEDMAIDTIKDGNRSACWHMGGSVSIEAGDSYPTGRKFCTLWEVGNYSLEARLKVDGDWATHGEPQYFYVSDKPPAEGRVDLYSGIDIPSTIYANQMFNIDFRLQEYKGGNKDLHEVAVHLTDDSGNRIDRIKYWSSSSDIDFTPGQVKSFNVTGDGDTAISTPGWYRLEAWGCISSLDCFRFGPVPGREGSVDHPKRFYVSEQVVYTPDLVVVSPSVSDSSLAPGDEFIINATVQNQGNGQAGETTLNYYISTNSTIDDQDTWVGADNIPWLTSGDSFSDRKQNVPAPSVSGTYWAGACVVPLSNESNKDNNCSSGVQITVTNPTYPDLIVTSPSVSKSTLSPGEEFTVGAVVYNQGNAASAPTLLRYYRSNDSSIQTSNTEIGDDSIAGMSAGGSITEQRQHRVAPTVPGTYWLGACVVPLSNESNKDNNCSDGVQITVVNPTQPELVVLSPSVSKSALSPTESFRIYATVKNQGDATALGTTLRYYLSQDSTISTTDTPYGTDSVVSLVSGGTSAEYIDQAAPSTVGTYWVGACVEPVSGESNTGNNCSTGVQISVQRVPLILPISEDFENDDHPWELEDHNGSASMVRVTDCGSNQGGCLRVYNSGVQTHGYEVQAKVVGIALQQGQAYRGRIRLKTDREEGIVVKAHRDIDPHDTFGLNHYCVANTQWQTCTFDFVAENHPEDDAGNVRFSLFLGEIVGNIWIDDFELVVKPNESIPFYENFDWGAHSMVLERPYNSGVTMDTSGDCGSTHSGCLVVTNDASYASTTDVQAKQVGFDIEQGKEHQGQLRLKTEQPSTVPVALMLNVSPYENLGLRIDCTTGFDWTACPFYFTPQGTDQYDGKDIRFTVKLGKIAGQTLIDEIKLQPVYHWPVSETFADDRHGWLLEDHGPSATMETLADCGGGRGGCLQITNAAVQDYGYSVQPQLLGMDIQYGERYQGQIRLRSELAASITIGFWLGVAPYDNLGMWEECETDSNWTTCSFDFIATVNKPYQPMDVRFAVQMGMVPGKVWIDDLWVERVEATPPPAPPVLPIDEDFEGSHGWILEDHHSSAVMETRSDCGSGQGACLYVDNSVAQTHDYEVQAKLLGLDLKNGRRYTGQILLKAEHPGPIDIGAYMNVHPYTYLGLWATCEVGTQWTVCNLDFVAEIPSGVSPEDIRIAVMLGDVPGSVWIDDFQLREADGSGCTEGSTVERDVTYPVNSVIKATGDISTSGAVVVNSGLDVEYRAERVTLNPGFYAKAGSTFTAVAETVSCGGGL